MGHGRDFLLVIADRVALVWVLEQQRMAFAGGRRSQVADLSDEDRLLLYTTRGCYHNPTRDRGRIIGTARLASPVTGLDPAVTVAGRSFELGCDLTIETIAPFPAGVELAPLVPILKSFPDAGTWSAHMRRPLVRLQRADAAKIQRQLAPTTRDPELCLASYRELLPKAPA